MVLTDNPVIKWRSPKRVLGATLYNMLPTTGQMIDSFIEHGLLENATGNYHIDIHDMCRNGATWLGVQMANVLGSDVEVVEGTFQGFSHCWVAIGNCYFDMTIAQADPSYPEFACVYASEAKGYSEFMRFPVQKWLEMAINK